MGRFQDIAAGRDGGGEKVQKKTVKKTVKKPAVKKETVPGKEAAKKRSGKQKENTKTKDSKKQTEKPEQKKQTILKPTVYNDSDFDDFSGDGEDDLSNLISEAQKAKLEQEIHKASLGRYKAEKEKIDFLEKAGKVAEVPYMEFVYISHIEKMHIDLLRMIDKIQPKMSPLVIDSDEEGLNKLLKNEISEIIRSVKSGQQEAVKSWKKDLKG